MSPGVLASMWQEEEKRVKDLEQKMKALLKEKQVGFVFKSPLIRVRADTRFPAATSDQGHSAHVDGQTGRSDLSHRVRGGGGHDLRGYARHGARASHHPGQRQ